MSTNADCKRPLGASKRLRPSNSVRLPCPGSFTLLDSEYDTENRSLRWSYSDAAEGTKRHEALEKAFRTEDPSHLLSGQFSTLLSLIELKRSAIRHSIEKKVYPRIPGMEKGGTLDYSFILPLEDGTYCLAVLDYKSGTRWVHPDTYQNICYGDGELRDIEANEGLTISVVTLAVISEEKGVSSLSYSRSDFLEAVDHVKALAERVEKGHDELVPGFTQCQFCPRKLYCEALLANEAFELINDLLDSNEVGIHLRSSKHLKLIKKLSDIGLEKGKRTPSVYGVKTYVAKTRRSVEDPVLNVLKSRPSPSTFAGRLNTKLSMPVSKSLSEEGVKGGELEIKLKPSKG